MAEKVLIVEDENIIALEIAWQLESLGYQVVGVSSRGEDAIRRVSAEKPDLILMDIRLKGELDGFQTAEAILTQSKIPIIYLSALVDDKLIDTLKKEKCTSYYLQKPFSEGELRKTIETIFRKDSNSDNKSLSQPTLAY